MDAPLSAAARDALAWVYRSWEERHPIHARAGVTTREELDALTPARVMERYFGAPPRGRYNRRSLWYVPRRGSWPRAQPRFVGVPNHPRARPTGSKEGTCRGT
jgi:hypothetical protein